MIVDIETDEVIQRLAKDLVSSGFYLLGDHIKNYCKKGVTVAENISCHALNGSRFSRNLNCLVRI
jgi:hypothetical protein